MTTNYKWLGGGILRGLMLLQGNNQHLAATSILH